MSLGAIAADTRNAAPEPAETAFLRDGFVGPTRLFTEAQCQIIVERLRRKDRPAPPDWKKARAVSDRFWYELATHPSLLSLLRSLLGDNVILFGASTVERRPGQTHTWHSDIETYAPGGGFVSVWIGIENTSRDSALQVIARSHLLGRTIQQTLQERGLGRSDATADAMLATARELDPAAELRQPAMGNGEMLLFDGRLWHGSHNARQEGSRLALLLQYAAADVPVFLPDLKQVEWPFRYLDSPRPPVIVVAGSAPDGVNRVVPAPPPNPEEPPLLCSGVHPFALPVVPGSKKHWRSQSILRGRSTVLDFFSCHITTLNPGPSPHPPHVHPEEEIEIVLDGEADFVISDSPVEEGARVERVRPGSFVYYPSFQHHTNRNDGAAPFSHLVFKWQGGAVRAGETLATGLFHYGELTPDGSKDYWKARLIRDPTPTLSTLGCHLSVLQPGTGYPPHSDAYDVAILLLAGEVETLDVRATAPSLIYCAAGEPHGMRNVGVSPARYLVFEFHPRPSSQAAPALEARSEPPRPVRDSAGDGDQASESDAPPPVSAAVRKAEKLKAKHKKMLEQLRREETKKTDAVVRQSRQLRHSGDAAAGLVVYRGVGTVIRQAHERLSAGDLDGALAVYREAPREVQRDAKFKARRKKLLKQLHRKTKKRAKDLVVQVRLMRRAGDIAAALSMCQNAPDAVREDPDVQFACALLLQQSGRLTEAYDVFRAVLASNTSHDKAWLGAGTTLLRLGRSDELAGLIDEMLVALPGRPQAVMQASALALKGGLHDLAGRLSDRAPAEVKDAGIEAKREKIAKRLRREEDGAQVILRQLGKLRTSGDVATALAVCEAAPAAVREDPSVQHHYARLLKRSRRFSDAYVAFRTVLERDPSRKGAWLGAASCLAHLGLRDELAALIDDMLAASPASSELLMEAASLARGGELHGLAVALCDRALSSATALSPGGTFEAARILLEQGEQGRVKRLLDGADARSDADAENHRLDLQGLAGAQLRVAGPAQSSVAMLERERADLIAVEEILRHTTDARARYRPVEDGLVIVIGSLGPGGAQTQALRFVTGLRTGQRQVGPIALLIANEPKLDPEFYRSTLAGLDIAIESIADFPVRLADLVPADIVGRLGALPREVVRRVAFLIDRLRSHRPRAVLAMGDVYGFPLMLAASIVGVPHVVISPRGEPPAIGGPRASLFQPGYQAALARNEIAMFTNSWATARHFAEWLGQPPDRIGTIHNGVDVDRLLAKRDPSATAAHRRALNIPEGARVVGSVFNYRREKRPELWIEAAGIVAARAPDVAFIHIGSGPMFNDFTSTFKRLGLEERFHGLGTRSDVATWVDLMDVFLLTSRSEGTPNVLLEAQALGRPVVATDVGGCAETFIPEETGVLLSPDPTPEQVADAVMRVLDDPDFAARVAERAPRFIRERFGIDRMVSEFVDVCLGTDATPGATGSRVQA